MEGRTKEAACDDAAPSAVQQPADVSRELLRLRAGKEHAEVQRLKKMVLGDPLLLLDQVLVHHGDLARGPPKLMNPSLSQ